MMEEWNVGMWETKSDKDYIHFFLPPCPLVPCSGRRVDPSFQYSIVPIFQIGAKPLVNEISGRANGH